MCLGRYSFGRWTIVEAILFFFFLMPTFLRFLLKSLHRGKEGKNIYSERGADAKKKKKKERKKERKKIMK
jgi:hypothetical protein